MIDYLLTWTEGWVGQTHLAFALVALISGALAIVVTKGRGKHRAIGYAYVASMLILNVSALMKYDLTGSFNLFHVFAIVSIVTISVAYGAILTFKRFKNRIALRVHGEMMIWSYFGLVMALIAEVVTRSFPSLLHGEGGWIRFLVMQILLALVTGFLSIRFIRYELRRGMSR